MAARQAASIFYEEMEDLLADREFPAGTYSFADIAFYMAQLFGDRMGAGMTAFLVSQGRQIPGFMKNLLPDN